MTELRGHLTRLTPKQRNAFIACFLGWALDAFDYFILTYCLSAVAADFKVGIKQVTEGLFWTLAMRPVGAFLFGAMAERYGRKPTLMLNVVSFAVFECASAFAPSLRALLVCRALFGIAMGGEWGVGAALTFETLPPEGRGFFFRPFAGGIRRRQSASSGRSTGSSFRTCTARACSRTGVSCF